MNLTLGSLFDGSGTAPLAAALCGITPVWASEIEPYPIRVTTKRFPTMLHLGSITDIDGAKVKPVDIICGGSPCQDLSVAGKQAGLDGGTRSHLFYEMTRIIKEMRKATDGKKPRYIVWENVPGAFSSNNGRDFLSVLQSFAEIAEADVHVPEPERKANKLVWRYAGEMVGFGWSIAWRTVDAQYWGVPQRRRRIYLVVDLDSERAGEILFERKSLSGNIEPGGETRKGTAADSESGAGGSCEETELIKAFDITGASSNSMKSLNAHSCFKEREISRTIDSFVASPECNQGGTAIVEYKNPAITRCLTAGYDALRDSASESDHCVVYSCNSKQQSMNIEENICNTLGANDYKEPQSVCYCLQGNGIDRADTAGCNGKGWKEDVSYTLNTIDRPAVCYTADCRNGVLNNEKSGTLQAKPNDRFSSNCINPVVFANSGFAKYKRGFATLKASGGDYGGGSEMLCVYDENGNNDTRYVIRRLTPLECSRLQGFPDYWELDLETKDPSEEEIAFWSEVFETHRKVVSPGTKPKTRNQIIKWLQNPYSDSASYKMWGNGMALPNMFHVMKGIVNLCAAKMDKEN